MLIVRLTFSWPVIGSKPVPFIWLVRCPGLVLPERYPTMSTQFSTYRRVILSLFHVHVIGGSKLSWLRQVQEGSIFISSIGCIRGYHIPDALVSDLWLYSYCPHYFSFQSRASMKEKVTRKSQPKPNPRKTSFLFTCNHLDPWNKPFWYFGQSK